MWFLTRLSLKNRAVTIFLAALLAGASIWATFQLKLELIPNIELPFRIIITVYPDASPDEVVSEVTTPIEDVIWERWEGKGLKHLFSTSADEVSVVFAEFEYGTSMAKVTRTIEEGIRGLDLPPAVLGVPEMIPQIEENPRIVEVDFSMMPLVGLSLSGNLPPDQLKDIAVTEIAPAMQDVDGVFEVELQGGEKEQVLISPDPVTMNALRVSMSQIKEVLGNATRIEEVVGNATTIEEVVGNATAPGLLQKLPIDGVALGELARVTLGPAPRTSITRSAGVPSVLIVVTKEAEANTVEVANAVVARAEEIEGELQRSLGDEVELELTPVFDQSEFIEESIGQLTQMALIGAGLAIIVVFLFLVAFRASLVTAMSIPFSIVIGFLAMYFSGITINLLTLSAMAIAVGRLIDNSIVVTEVIYRRLQRGEGFREAALNGSKEVAGPITSSTLATVAIFIPLIFVGGLVGEFFIPFALTITFALIASLLVALIVVPVFSGWFGGRKEKDKEAGGEISRQTWYQKLYIPSLKWALGHRAVTLVVIAALLGGSFALVPLIGTSLLPSMTEKELHVEIELPPGTDVGTTSQVAAGVEALLIGNDEIEKHFTIVGTSTSSMHGVMHAAFGGGDNTAEIVILLDSGADMEKERDDLELAVERIMLGDFVTVMTAEEAMETQMGAAGVEITIQGNSYDDLRSAAGNLTQRLGEIEGLSDLESQVTMEVHKLHIELDPSKMAALGLTEEQMDQLDNEKLLLTMGGNVTSVNIDGEDYRVFLTEVAGRLRQAGDPEALAKALPVGYPQSVPLGNVAVVEFGLGPTHISHADQKLAATIEGTVSKKDVGAVNRDVKHEIDAVLDEVDPLGVKGIEIKMGGVAEEMEEYQNRMIIAILAAIVIAYLILVVSMRSILNPLIIMVSLPLASIGALLGLLISGHTLGMSGAMGVLMLVGIVLTNAIVLIALVEQLRKQGMNTYDALVEGGRTRLRPILMTALTTMFAMLPLAFGLGGGTLIAGELAVVVIGGLFSSTLLTLLVIPVIYSLVDGLRRRFARAS